MNPKLYFIDFEKNTDQGRLAAMPKPMGWEWLDADIAGIAEQNIHQVISLLEAEEINSKGLEQEAEYCQQYGMEFSNLPLPDMSVPDEPEELMTLIKRLHESLQAGKNIVVHCWGGIGRTGLVVIGILLRSGYSLDDAIAKASSARGCSMPCRDSQVEWLQQYAEQINT